MDMVKFTIDGKEVEAEKGAYLLDVARENGVRIPTLCWHESIESPGACRMCVVEVKQGKRTRVVTSCLYPVSEGIEVKTQTDRVKHVRKVVLQLQMARCPESKELKDMADEMGVKPEPRFTPDATDNTCILCRMCVRTCEQVVGVSAIGFSYRGTEKVVGTPFKEQSKVCIGCGACAFVCPTHHIKMTGTPEEREIWGRNFKMMKCKTCGNYFAPIEQLEWISKKTGVPMDKLSVCQACK
ncbi:MAG TPA: 2Fe-2S iron-sulfur cluster-binding protein [Syntrophales bacterium]|nr:2Fe-2S iron-sulfur cluster-binding protein [Syntrophales bacterium]